MTTKKKNSIPAEDAKKVSERFLYSGICFGQGFQVLFQRYHTCESSQDKKDYILPVCFILAHALECYFKAYLSFQGMTVKELRKREFGHNLENLHKKAIEEGLYEIVLSPMCLPDADNASSKEHIQELVDSLHGIHCGEDDYADRYMKYDTETGYPTFFWEAGEAMTDLQCVLLSKMPYPRILWTDRTK
ncbi:MAG: hypothetical protein ABF876_09640 [Acetobacter aceti]|uniref:HEPN domain-containing protein n=1 Tax=Acetobacter aceti TaxID=435 RepID=A0A1U9KCV5_ACEAC|nr:hypothetical protein [Acetobacter aceti]AQS83592.1 hypothetical protein A0U92_01085 [Acetobacter aceti]